jgi:hypothetical protein
LTFEVDVCANPGKFGVNFGAIYVQNPGKISRLDVGMSHNPGKILGLASVCSRNFSWVAIFFGNFFVCMSQNPGILGSPTDLCTKVRINLGVSGEKNPGNL